MMGQDVSVMDGGLHGCQISRTSWPGPTGGLPLNQRRTMYLISPSSLAAADLELEPAS
jgi:hypothetical protein